MKAIKGEKKGKGGSRELKIQRCHLKNTKKII